MSVMVREDAVFIVQDVNSSLSLHEAFGVILSNSQEKNNNLPVVQSVNTVAAVITEIYGNAPLGVGLGALGYALSWETMIEQLADGQLTVADAAAASALIGAALTNIHPRAAAFFNLYSLALSWAEKIGHWAGQTMPLPNEIGEYFAQAGHAINLRDPLALDLNHDGQITTISTDEGITFDHGATGVEYGTGWIDSGDAWLALDLNGNGVIDSGRELFGDNTIKLDDNRATDAFDALMSFDSNGDGKVDAADASGDVDLDGIMEAGETFWDINRNGVFDADDKTFVDLRLWKAANSDGIAGSYDTAQFNLTENRFFREFDSSLTVSSTAAALPNMKGSGAVLDLQGMLPFSQ